MSTGISNEFKLLDKHNGLYLQVLKPNINSSLLLAELDRRGINIHPQLMSKILTAPSGAVIKLLDKKGNQSNKTFFSSSQPFDLEIAPNKMQAYVTVNPDSELSISKQEILVKLNEMGINYGIDENSISYAIQLPGNRIVAAAGKYPLPGKDGKVEYFFHPPQKNPVLCEDGSVNYYELGSVIPISAGQIISRRTFPTPGQPGTNIYSEEVPAVAGKIKYFNVGKGIITSDDKAIAEYDGALTWINDKILISKLLVINGDVDFSQGNIDFMGKVIIAGNIKDGFKVEATDDIEIRGGIENAQVTSHKGSVFVQKGIIGKEGTFIKAAKNVEARFIQEANVEAGQNIVVNEYTIRSNLRAGDAVLIQGRKGRILGNNVISARTRIKASGIMNSKSLDLKVEGIQRKQIHEQIRDLTAQIMELEEQLKKIAEKIRKLRDSVSDPQAILLLQKLLPQYITINEELDQLNDDRKSLVSMLNSTIGEGMIEIGGNLEAGMVFGIKEESFKLDSQVSSIRMYYDPEAKRIILI
ncbi:MAG: FapA family protein [Syntrophomonadaceae bacterium]|nr:FapA family protein [Syntrophomonadaceae bacterium]MDD3022523.1 FapA family protein [Syntrophomonadaceae bacterium]